MKHLSVMLKPASSLCNLRCRYCFYANIAGLREVRSFGVMDAETTDRVLANIRTELERGDEVVFAFQGGEPTLAGLDYFRHFSAVVDGWDRGVTVRYALQTNATLLDEAWCAYLREYGYLVGVSLDLQRDAHNDARVDAGGSGTWRTVTNAIRMLEKHRVEYNVLCTLTNPIARHPDAVWRQILALDLKYVQFTPCLAELDAAERGVYALTPERFASFYTRLFRLWLAEFRAGRYRSVKLFDDVIGYLATGVPSTCDASGRCRAQLVVEADGGAYPCDFYCLDAYRLGSLARETPRSLSDSAGMRAFLSRPRDRLRICASCPYDAFCGGGCARMQREVCGEIDARSCGYRTFLDACMPDMLTIAREERRYR